MIKSNKYFIKDDQSEENFKYKIRRLVSTIRAIYYKIRLTLATPKVLQKKYNVSICAIFKNEAMYLKEWIEFNNIVGVEHFYLYNNNSDDDYQAVLKPYIDKGIVTLMQWPYDQKQMECYMTCIKEYSFETKWLGFIDIDEFIVPKTTDSIYEFLQQFEKKAGSVNIYWKIFGSSGKLDRKLSGLVSDNCIINSGRIIEEQMYRQ